MARPTINFRFSTLITADGEYVFEVQPNVPYSFVSKGIFGGGTLTLTAYDPKLDASVTIEGGSWSDTFEDGFTSPFAVLTLTVAGAMLPSISVTAAPKKLTVHPS